LRKLPLASDHRGGPLLRKSFLETYTYAKKKGFIVTLFTNATLMTTAIVVLVEWPPHKVKIALYGATKETYDRITGIPSSFERCKRGVGFLLERNIPLELKTMVVTLNHYEFWGRLKFSDQS
jgi:MoaA/NifB/PqqE/SkfB family radical SAM enzyme